MVASLLMSALQTVAEGASPATAPVVVPVVPAVISPTFTPWQILVMTLPAIIAQMATLIGALSIFYGVWAKRTGEIGTTVTQTAGRMEVVHRQTEAIVRQADKIAEQTNGHLSRITDDGVALRNALMQVLSIVSAREGNVPGIRGSDLPRQEAVEGVVKAVDEAVNGQEENEGAEGPGRVVPPPPERRKKPR